MDKDLFLFGRDREGSQGSFGGRVDLQNLDANAKIVNIER
jgi:hypothetical protein